MLDELVVCGFSVVDIFYIYLGNTQYSIWYSNKFSFKDGIEKWQNIKSEQWYSSMELESGSTCKNIALNYSCEKQRKLVFDLLNLVLYFTHLIYGGLIKVNSFSFWLFLWVTDPLVTTGLTKRSRNLTALWSYWDSLRVSKICSVLCHSTDHSRVELQWLVFCITFKSTSQHTVNWCIKTVKENHFKH